MSYTKKLYNKSKKEIQDHFSLKNVMEIPAIKKISINVAVKATDNSKNILSYIEKELSLITGQKPVASIAKKSIAGFKLRQNSVIGYYVTLRNKKINKGMNYHYAKIQENRLKNKKVMEV